MKMTHKERAVAALNRRQPDFVPTFELEFQLEEEMFGRKFITDELLPSRLAVMSETEKRRAIDGLADYMVQVYDALEYSIIPGLVLGDAADFWNGQPLPQETKWLISALRERVGDTQMIHYHGDGTFAIPDGAGIMEFAYGIADDPDGMKEKAENMANAAIERNKYLAAAGVDCLILCSDYCFNSGPFVSPAMFAEYIQPYLARIIEAARSEGLYTIKHTDGNIMPILDQLVDCHPHALHSLDPMAGVDIRDFKQKVGDQVCLCGNVDCSLMQTGTEEQVIESARYCLTHGKPVGGYFFATSNVPFKGLPPERYQLILDVWKQMRDY